MAVLRVLESDDTGVHGTVRRAPFSVVQTPVTIGADGATRSAAFGSSTRIVTIQADAICHVAFGRTPTATTSHFKLAAGETADFEVQGGDKVAVIQGT